MKKDAALNLAECEDLEKRETDTSHLSQGLLASEPD
jgi:hypothetical protein